VYAHAHADRQGAQCLHRVALSYAVLGARDASSEAEFRHMVPAIYEASLSPMASRTPAPAKGQLGGCDCAAADCSWFVLAQCSYSITSCVVSCAELDPACLSCVGAALDGGCTCCPCVAYYLPSVTSSVCSC
jgi:hypothetical protein